MTELEKLANEWFLKNRDLNEGGEGVFSMEEAFIAGFRKARDMIKESIKAELGSDEALKTIGLPFELGESEVES